MPSFRVRELFMNAARRSLAAIFVCTGISVAWADSPVVPGSGQKIQHVSDDFEDANWEYIYNLPKSSSNINGHEEHPLGGTNNGLWVESPLRGQPDLIKRVATPAGGLPGSKGAMLLQSMQTGIPGRTTGKMQQDDLLLNANMRLGAPVGVAQCPSFTCRVYLPKWEQWEQRIGTSLGIRTDCVAYTMKSHGRGIFRRQNRELESYWPGMFIQYNGKSAGEKGRYSATILVRGDELGHDIPKLNIYETGWWTFGLSVTGDGLVHYYAKLGVKDLTQADHIATMRPYGFTAESVGTFFFNVSTEDDGRTWSTPWIIDDANMYIGR